MPGAAWFLCRIFGYLGAHKFYLGKPHEGVLCMVTFGGLTFWWIHDMFTVQRETRKVNSERALRLANEICGLRETEVKQSHWKWYVAAIAVVVLLVTATFVKQNEERSREMASNTVLQSSAAQKPSLIRKSVPTMPQTTDGQMSLVIQPSTTVDEGEIRNKQDDSEVSGQMSFEAIGHGGGYEVRVFRNDESKKTITFVYISEESAIDEATTVILSRLGHANANVTVKGQLIEWTSGTRSFSTAHPVTITYKNVVGEATKRL